MYQFKNSQICIFQSKTSIIKSVFKLFIIVVNYIIKDVMFDVFQTSTLAEYLNE